MKVELTADAAQWVEAEVAAALGRSEGAVYLLRVRAHRRLAELMGAPANYITKGT